MGEPGVINYEFHDEQLKTHSRKVNQWLGEAISLMKKGSDKDAEKAQVLLKQALEVEPDSPDLLNNLAATYEIQNRREEGVGIMHDIVERFPDYVFARVSVARMHILKGEIEAAEALLKPLVSRKRFHFDEFAAFCNGYIELLLAEDKKDGAIAWLKMWEGIDPDRPDIMTWKLRLEGPGILKKLSKLGKWGLGK
ncbi:tetratricopeptide repeat protein [Iningainema tapete]|uniref:Tetratricopeptide repeat protein n=1 Tax=Iningainema tapete BLCC-T55 TaxID=2748662 RepID=A0A8J7BZW9_9CYAN|nr:tetratricopeptide repeat protein [Iningainema tapete]MBD2778622.1 tetratricopeptide repeat protein [Iningainema tapete BLCC-T55]